jgi:hypothetical protein
MVEPLAMVELTRTRRMERPSTGLELLPKMVSLKPSLSAKMVIVLFGSSAASVRGGDLVLKLTLQMSMFLSLPLPPRLLLLQML